jgi:hypothetical protein
LTRLVKLQDLAAALLGWAALPSEVEDAERARSAPPSPTASSAEHARSQPPSPTASSAEHARSAPPSPTALSALPFLLPDNVRSVRSVSSAGPRSC